MLRRLEIPERAHWDNATIWLLWTVLSIVIPLFGSALLFWVISENRRVVDLFSQGQLGLYAAALISTPAYICSIDREVTRLRWRGGLMFASISVLAVSTMIYAGVQAAVVKAADNGASPDINERLTIIITAVALIGAIVVAFFATVSDGERQQRSFAQVIDRQQRELADEFRDLT